MKAPNLTDQARPTTLATPGRILPGFNKPGLRIDLAGAAWEPGLVNREVLERNGFLLFENTVPRENNFEDLLRGRGGPSRLHKDGGGHGVIVLTSVDREPKNKSIEPYTVVGDSEVLRNVYRKISQPNQSSPVLNIRNFFRRAIYGEDRGLEMVKKLMRDNLSQWGSIVPMSTLPPEQERWLMSSIVDSGQVYPHSWGKNQILVIDNERMEHAMADVSGKGGDPSFFLSRAFYVWENGVLSRK